MRRLILIVLTLALTLPLQGGPANKNRRQLLKENEELLKRIEELEQENKGLRDHHKEVMEELREASKALAHEIGQPVQDRKAISNIAGTIGIITGRELR